MDSNAVIVNLIVERETELARTRTALVEANRQLEELRQRVDTLTTAMAAATSTPDEDPAPDGAPDEE